MNADSDSKAPPRRETAHADPDRLWHYMTQALAWGLPNPHRGVCMGARSRPGRASQTIRRSHKSIRVMCGERSLELSFIKNDEDHIRSDENFIIFDESSLCCFLYVKNTTNAAVYPAETRSNPGT